MRYMIHRQIMSVRDLEVTAESLDEARRIANEMPEGAWQEIESTYTDQVHTHEEDWMVH